MRSVFETAMAIVFANEGLHSVDDGGETWFGIARKFHPNERPWPPSRERATEIYREQYFERYHCGELPPPLAIGLFDAVVNQPAHDVIEELQRALRVEPDGIMGSETIHAANNRDRWETLALFFGRRARRYVQRSDEKYQVGLLARLFRAQRAILASGL